MNTETPAPGTGTVLVFDFGMKHIGIAVAEPQADLAWGLTTIPARDGKPRWNVLDPLVREWRPERLVVGLPVNMDGTPSEASLRARHFGRRLAVRYALAVDYADERLSTFEAVSRGAHADDAHAQAAEIIGETWLSERAPHPGSGRSQPPSPR